MQFRMTGLYNELEACVNSTTNSVNRKICLLKGTRSSPWLGGNLVTKTKAKLDLGQCKNVRMH